MKYSLKMYLIVVCALGAIIGLMGNLFLNRPRMFLEVVGFATTTGPFAAAIVIIALFGVRGRRSRLIVVLLLLAPLVLPTLVGWVLPSDPLHLMSTRQLIRKELPGQIETPWIWNELASRVSTGRVTNAEADEAISMFAKHMKTNKPAGWGQPLHWNRGFLNAAFRANLVSDEVLFEFCDAYYGPQIIAKPIPMLVEGQRLPPLNLEYGNPFAGPDMPVELVWDVKQVLIDGKPVQYYGANRMSNRWLAGVTANLPVGEHELVYEVECAYIDAKLLNGVNVYGLPISKWPKARKQWSTTVKVPIKVEALERLKIDGAE
jgi:hypothetical protein